MDRYEENLKCSLQVIAKKLSAKEKGILAADESIKTIGKRFKNICENNFENRTRYRNLLFTTPDLEKYISGVILFEETITAKINGENIIDNLKKKNIIIGYKADQGLVNLSGTNSENITQGLDNLDERLKKVKKHGVLFTKWRCTFNIKDLENPSEMAIDQNLNTLCRFAYLSQRNGMVPIIEPEVLADGNHTEHRSYDVTLSILSKLYGKLNAHKVILSGTLLKPNVIRPGAFNEELYESFEDIIPTLSGLTVRALQNSVPLTVPGIMFLSGGLGEEPSAEILNEMNKMETNKPWRLSFSYGRALQESCLKTWNGEDENIESAQKQLIDKAKKNSFASMGKLDLLVQK